MLKTMYGNKHNKKQKCITPTQQPQVNVPHVTLVDHFRVSKFSKQQHLQALKLERPVQFFTKSLAIVSMSSTY